MLREADGGEKRICFFYGDFNGAGGAERSAISIANGLVESGCKVFLLSLHGGDAPFFLADARIERCQLFNKKISFKKNYLRVLLRLRKFSKKNRINIWIDVDPVVSVFSVPAFLGRRCAHIAWEHFNFNNDLGRSERRIGRRLAARFADIVIVLTQRDREMWIEQLNPRASIKVIYNPFPFDFPKESKFNEKAKTVLSVGRLIDLKGFDLLLHAWATVKERSEQLNDWRLTIVGDGPEAATLRQMASEFGVSGTVRFAGRQSNVEKYYEESGIYCLSSRTEGLPMVLIEAQAFGIPVVAFDCPTGPSEVVTNEVDGILVPPQNPSALANALEKVMSDGELRSRFARNSRSAAQRFDRQMIVDQWNTLCEDALK
ncbi:glycosyltransferase family 4 protein [Burkholderia pseudomultivorans]|uniref:GalNAc-alpha-(1->4)-GalNAc-alpha-(1->3)-diNAcBac-PP-undecaprenol alpha-1,4-N-acetyl-D-galactosaminyltransferase n=1 Tax=Burkholderia pseudomultivorans TaxID=1207504 RepID=A0ABU2E227_9BURK|nr:glycosyltransferase family 4 protein [Burkholderia pseudomultivorans]MDR8726491.1 GalNAc-alpha-(1->4)-GalNAc-alpha-(1->3)-diNAcBac-PP-undecaprenol alpha-1,4-N-acetyl-D-galactosaminyltransferase [Burkholderia pseudomultivorans]MDR8736324.1 GalNAc-alpha-(1->4)-GalNAc-alpha-(1->3)-diNAcBac-PP-undecaprenol alpha-1,4-N-acetyl-D-galactosaminyltransferase [Burkholderia pseudomultivorans]MDR8742138.1 GalNAc-alpha-(1->4)-GalNAc-alpha-(1->3)-diNAcBac-PP-undecaprenol alpha-1,4-N-acetyl-D-galactosaminylt